MSRILVVDDMALCREPIAEALRANGYEVECAADGREALNILRKRQADLVLLDLNMPELDGLAVLRTMRRNPDLMNIPVILLTDRAERETVAQALQRGVQGYLLKSAFSLPELLTRVQRSLGQTPVAAAAATTGSTGQADRGTRFTQWRSQSESAPGVAKPAPGGAAPSKRSPAGTGPTTTHPAQARPAAGSVAELQPVITKNDLIKLVNEGLELRPLGPTVHNVLAVSGSAGCSAEDVAKAVGHDQALAIRILKLANSSAYSRGNQVDTIREAVQRIGVQELRSLVMTLGVFDQFEGAAADRVDPRMFWEHSIACGLAASALAKACQFKKVDDCFLWGMVHDVGRLILLEHVADAYAQVWDAAEKLAVPLEAVEPRLMLLDHCDILDRALEHWQFPREFIAPVVNHHHSVPKIKRLGPGQSEPAAMVALANQIAHAMLIGSSGNDVIYPLDDLVDYLGLSPATVGEIAAEIPYETNNLKFAMLARSNEQGWPDFVSTTRQGFDLPIRPLCMSLEPKSDAFRMACERLATAFEDQPPNVGVIYLREAAEQLAVCERFEAAEREQGALNLPLLVLCNRGSVSTDLALFQERPTQFLQTPVRIATFVEALNALLH